MPATDLKIGKFLLIPNFNKQKRISKKLQPLRKGIYQIVHNPTEVTHKLTDSKKKSNCSTPKQPVTLLSKRKRASRINSINIFHRLTNCLEQSTIGTKSKHH